MFRMVFVFNFIVFNSRFIYLLIMQKNISCDLCFIIKYIFMVFKPFKLSVFITCVKTRFFVLFWFKDRKGVFF